MDGPPSEHADQNPWDVIIVGAGPAGLSAALILGRCCRSVLICDRGTPRSWASKAMHGFITRESMPPDEFRRAALQELSAYPNVTFRRAEATGALRSGDGFLVDFAGSREPCRKLLIATGVMDELPAIEGFVDAFGISAFQCPYCDGWEARERRVAIYGRGQRGYEMARAFTAWSRDIVLCTDGASRFRPEQREHLRRNDIAVIEARISRLEFAQPGQVSHVVFADGQRVACEAIFFDTPSHGQSRLTEQLGCRFNRQGNVLCGKYEATSVPGVYVAGNIIRNVQLSIVAAAEGANAAFGINLALTREEFARRATGWSAAQDIAPAS
jgi:thioredoxin reductase